MRMFGLHVSCKVAWSLVRCCAVLFWNHELFSEVRMQPCVAPLVSFLDANTFASIPPSLKRIVLNSKYSMACWTNAQYTWSVLLLNCYWTTVYWTMHLLLFAAVLDYCNDPPACDLNQDTYCWLAVMARCSVHTHTELLLCVVAQTQNKLLITNLPSSPWSSHM